MLYGSSKGICGVLDQFLSDKWILFVGNDPSELTD